MKVKDTALSARQVKAGPDDGLEDGQFTAYASVFGNVDSYGDVVTKGAFADSLSSWGETGNPIPLLYGHNMSDPDFNIGHVKSAVEDDYGLLITSELDLENPKAAQVHRMLKGGRVNQMSYAYDVVDSGPTEVDGVKATELRQIKLYEVSVVAIGANQATEVLSVKAQVAALAEGLKAGRVLASKHISSLREAQEAIGVVIAAAEATEDQEKASGTGQATDEEPVAAKSQEPRPNPSAVALALQLQLLSH